MDGLQHKISPLVASAADVALERLQRLVGSAGFAAMSRCPGLLAEVDQHAAEVREALGEEPGQVPAPVRLAAYADGVVDTAAGHGWQPDEAIDADWPRASWPLVRLLAVCVLARPAT
jgi:hypothetical protein